jgi:hypothetical protein
LSDYSVALDSKIGDILLSKAYLDKVHFLYDHVNVSIVHEQLNWRSSDDKPTDTSEYQEFLRKLIYWLFSEENYVIDLENTTYKNRSYVDICFEHELDPSKPDLKRFLPLFEPKDHIIIMTKARRFDEDLFHGVSRPIWEALREKSKSHRFIVMGEREIEPCYEKRVHGKIILSLYDAIVKNLPKENLIDLTVPALGITSSNFEKFRSDCNLINTAKTCVTFGEGGGFCMAMCFGSCLCYSNMHDEFVDKIFYNGFCEGSLVTDDVSMFVEAIEAL